MQSKVIFSRLSGSKLKKETIYIKVSQKLYIIWLSDCPNMQFQGITWDECMIIPPDSFSFLFVCSIASESTPLHASSMSTVRNPCSKAWNAVKPAKISSYIQIWNLVKSFLLTIKININRYCTSINLHTLQHRWKGISIFCEETKIVWLHQLSKYMNLLSSSYMFCNSVVCWYHFYIAQ